MFMWSDNFQELEEQYEQLRAHNEGKNIFKLAGTPAVFATVAVLAYLFSLLASLVGVQSAVALGHMAAVSALILLAVWAYAR